MRPSSREVEAALMEKGYIDTQLIDLHYNHKTHSVTLKYKAPGRNEGETAVLFKDCFSASFNTWLEGMEGDIPDSPNELSFFIHEISIKDVKINGIQLYECSMIIPMMDCRIVCKTIVL